MTCPDCERYKQSASMWRNKAYELNGTPLPWKPDELWVGLTEDDWDEIFGNALTIGEAIKVTEAKLKEKNT